MRICFFNRSYYPDLGATGQLLTELAEDLVGKHGWYVTVIAGPALSRGTGGSSGRARWGLFERQEHNGVDIYRAWGTTYGRRHFLGRFANYLSYAFSAFWAGLRAPEADVVVSLTDPPIIGLAALAAAKRSGARFVFLCQDVFPEVARLLEDFHSRTVDRILQWVNRFLVRKADRVIVLGETMQKRLVEEKGARPEKVTVIHNWADCEAIVPGPKANPFTLAHGLADRFVVMHSGNVGLSQGLETLVDACRYLQSNPDLAVLIVGDGVKRASLEERVRSLGLANIRFLSYQPKEEIKHSFAAADVLVVSLKPGLAGYIVPSKLYGILAAGRPYVAVVEEECEVAAITRRFECGLVSSPGDPQDLADRIRILYEDRHLARRLGDNARRAALEFDRRKQVATYHEVFRNLASAQASERRTSAVKRAFDIALSGFGLLVSVPVWVLIASAIRLEDGGPVFFVQERVGRGGRVFRSLKFRSMIPDADRTLDPIQAGENDPRVTRVGRLLRATAMDELPQLWNIFRGDMSFVGPRALAAREIELGGDGSSVALKDIPGYVDRQAVRPGLTGIAQVFARRDIPRRKKFRYDLLYVRKQSFCLDLRLIAISFWITFRAKWEAREPKF